MRKKSAAFRMRKIARAARTLTVLAGVAGPGLALAQLSFSQSPPISSSAPGVKPNIILAIDNSSSMMYNSDVAGSQGATRMAALVNSLRTTFGDASLTGRIRLAYESMWMDAGFGPNRAFKSTHDNSMRVLDAAYQADFLQWVNTLTTHVGPSTPSHWMIIHAGEYLKGNVLGPNSATNVSWTFSANGNNTSTGSYTGNDTLLNFVPIASDTDNPWKMRPGDATDTAAPLACRRSYFIFLSDGLWNDYMAWGPGSMVVKTPPPYVSKLSGNADDKNYDGMSHMLPDGTLYDASLPIYADDTQFDASPLSASSTLSDFAMYYWANDLQGNIDNQLDAGQTRPVKTDQTVSYQGSSVTYTPYWNPQNDPATWQHMQTYTIGFGGSGAWSQSSLPGTGAGNIPAYSGKSVLNGTDGTGANPFPSARDTSFSITVPTAFDSVYGNFFNAYASGYGQWPQHTGRDASPDNILDLVHAAYNGRGKFYPVTSQTALTQAFNDILQTAITQSAPGGIGSTVASGSRLTGDTVAYIAGYGYTNDPSINSIGGWYGTLTANKGDDLSQLWSATIPAAASRQIFTASPSGAGIPFTAASLTAGPTPDPSGITAATITAVRGNTLGDIVNSQLVYVGKPSRLNLSADYIAFANSAGVKNRKGVVYVGANDGMLHGFDAGQGTSATPGSGAELMAYVPRGLLGKLSAFVSGAAHRYWVDSGMFSGDAQLSTGAAGNPGNWATVLVGALGAGGRGYFVLDVTNPATFTQSPNGFANGVLIDATDLTANGPLAAQNVTNGALATPPTPVTDVIGYQFSQPVMDVYAGSQPAQIVQINTGQPKGEWAVIMGNGYNNALGVPVLLIQSLSRKTGGVPNLYTVAATCTAANPADCVSAGNGLGAPRPVDVDGNGTADIVYAGDLMGNLWKFDISSVDQTKWKVAYNQKPMFTAVGPTGVAQPITSAPVVVPNKSGGFMVAFGTGKNLTQADTQDAPASANAPPLNSFYALYDMEQMKASFPTIAPAAGQTPAIVASQIGLLEDTLSKFCTAGSGAARYASCLYEQTGGTLSNAGGSLSAGATTAPAAPKIDGNPMLGWYYDIPETDNGNTGKVLSNPIMMSDNTVVFFSDNVASASGGNSNAQNNGDETCDPVTASGAITTVNFFNVITGIPPDNITITVDGQAYSFDNTGNNADATKGNRFRRTGKWGKQLRDDTDSLKDPSGDQLKNVVPDPIGRHTGWHFGR